MKLRNCLFTVFLSSAGLSQAQLENLPQAFKPLDVSHLNTYYPGPYGGWFPSGIDQQAEARQRYLYLGPLGVQGLAHVPEYMYRESCKAITNPALRSSNGEIEIPYYEVLGVDPKAPAASFLLAGDLIVGVDGVDLKSGSLYNPENDYSTKNTRTLFECLGDAIDRAEGTGSITFNVMRLPANLPPTTTIPDRYVEVHRTDLVDNYEDRNIEIDVSAAGMMKLIAENAGDGNGNDHAYWLEARWVKTDGTEVLVTDQEWLSISVGYGSPTWGNQITYSGGTTTNSLFAHAPSEVLFKVPDGMDKFRVTLRNNSYGSIIGSLKTSAVEVDYGDLEQYITGVTIPVAKIGSYLAGGAEREHKLEQMIVSQSAWLLGEQRADGGWSSLGSYTSDIWDTAYIGLAMLAADEPRFDEAAKRAAYYIVNEGRVTDWSSPRGIVLTFLGEYYLRTGDEGILPGLQVAVNMVEQNLLAQGYAGHKIGYGYGTGGQNSGFSYMAMGLAVASRTPVEVDKNLLDKMLVRMDAMAVNGTIGYGRSTSTTFNANAGAVNAVAMTGPCVAANSITGTSQRFFDLSKAAMERSVGGLDFGHSSQTYGLFGGTLSTINLGDALYLRHQELTMPKMILQRYYAGGVIASECRNEYMGAEGFFRPRMATAIQVLTLAAGRKNLAITGKSELQAATMKPGHYTHVWDMETHRFWMRAWSVAIELLGDDAPASLYTGYNALKTVSYDGALNELHDDIYTALETHALTAVGDINALTGVSDQLKAEAIEMLLGMDLNIQVTEKDTDLADVSLSAYWPLRERNRWADSATQNAWKANASYITSGSISIANGGALSSDVTIAFDSSTAGTDMKQGYSSSLGTVQVTRLDGANTFTLPVQISYTVGSHSISYTRDVTFEAGLGGNVEDARYVTIPSCRVLRKTKGDELVVEVERTGEYLQMHGPLPAVFHQGEKVSVEFKQLNLALGGHRNATTLGSPLTWYRGVAFSATPGATMTQGDIDNLLDANVGTSSRSQTQSGQTWAGFEMDLGSAKLINGILIEDQGYNVYKVEAEIGGEWTQIFSGGFFTGPDYFGDYTVQKLRIYWQTNGSGYTPNITDIQVFYNAYGSSETEVAQNHEDGVATHWRLWQEKYDGLSSGTIAALTSNVNYPDSPSYSGPLYKADSGSNIGDSYGQRWTGWITPDETGDFVFYAAADDQVELYLSTDEHPSNKGLIASKYTWTSAYNWSGGAISAPVSLIAGKKYYIELLHAEGGGGDNCAIAWKKPSDTAAPANGTAGIGESYFSTVVGGVDTNVNYVYPAITSQPNSVVATAGQPASFSLVAGGAGSLSYQWMKNGVVVPGANAATYSIASASAVDTGTYTCLIRNEYGQVLSQGADLSFTNQSPVATDASFSLSEGVTVGTSVGSVTATDADVGTALSYAITAGNTENVFTINTATGEISTAGDLDYEYLNGYLLEVTVTDNGSPALSDTALVAITVDNAYDVAPIMADVDAKVVDDVVAGTLVAQMSAFDPEDGDSVSFSITAGNIGGAFVIDSSTGRVTTATSLDSTVTGIYSLEVTATDLGGSSDTATLDVIVYKAVGAIAWNFSQRGDSTMVQGDGSIFGTDQWTDSVDHAAPNGTVAANSTDSWAVTTPINASMVSVAWSSSNMYQSGSSTTLVDQLFRKYLDDGGAGPQISVSGLNQWLSGVGASNYTVTFYQGSDTSNNNFAQMNIYDGSDTSGTLLESMPATLTDGSGAGGGSRLVRIADGLFTGDAITFHTDRSLGGGNRASVSGFKITAVQYPNSAPLADNATVSLAEDAVVGTAVATVNATDPDVEDILTYSITAGNGGGEFAINSSTGEITTTTALDYEAAAQYVLTVDVSDGSLTDIATITVDVTNVNEAPVANGASGNVNEDAAVGTTVATVTSSDPDAGDSATYAITAGNDGSFAIDSATGVITTAAGLDYETTSSYTLTVEVTDGGGLTDTASVGIAINDVANDDSDSDGLVDEWEIANFGSVSATDGASDSDGDGLSNAEEMAIGGDPNSSDSDSDGFADVLEVTVGTDLADAQSTPDSTYSGLHSWWNLNEAAGATTALDNSGSGFHASVNDVTFNGSEAIFDGVNDGLNAGTAAAILGTGDYTVSAKVKTAAGFNSLGVVIQQRDPGGTGYLGEYMLYVNANGTVTYFIYNNGYQVNLTTTITVNDGNWHHIMAVRSGGTVTVYIDGVQAAQGSGAVQELLARSVAIGYDHRDNNNYFNGSIDDVRVYNRAVGNLEFYPNSAPTASDDTFSVNENAAAGTSVGTVIATDPDAGDILAYAITAGNAGGEFAIDAGTGAITTTAALDYETASQYVLTVEVTDSSLLTDTAIITVNVNNVNEAPVANDASGSVAEDVAIGTAVATVTSSDVDAGDSVSYAITAGNDGSFVIDSSTGAVTLAGMLDYENTSSYVLTVTATDGGGLADTATVTVTVLNVVVEDYDSDSMDDNWEIANFGDTTSSDGTGDADNDGLTDGEEYLAGSDPNSSDGDGDGFHDVLEINVGTDPMDILDFPASEYDGLVLWWNLDESAGASTVLDDTGNKMSGAVNGATLNGSEGSFDGSNDSIDLPLASGPMGAFSVSLWVKNGATGQNQYASVFCNRHPSGGDSFQIDMGDGFRYNGGTKASFGAAPVGTWVHLVVASDGTDTKLYYNGALAATLTGISNGVFEGFYLGVNRNGNKYFNGSVKDVRLYDREVDISEFYPAP